MILLFQMNSHPSLAAINGVAFFTRQEVRYVEESQYTTPLKDLAFPELALPKAPKALQAPLPSLPEPMMLFAGMDHEEVSRFIDLLNQTGAPRIALKAVLTPTSMEWTPLELYEHLKEEHAYYEDLAKQRKEENQ